MVQNWKKGEELFNSIKQRLTFVEKINLIDSMLENCTLLMIHFLVIQQFCIF